jgi:hypothetical protein
MSISSTVRAGFVASGEDPRPPSEDRPLLHHHRGQNLRIAQALFFEDMEKDRGTTDEPSLAPAAPARHVSPW